MKKMTKLEADLLIIISFLKMLNLLLCKWLLKFDKQWVRPQNDYSYELFFIYLIDFLSKISMTQKNLPNSLLYFCDRSKIPFNNDALKKELKNFNEWLNKVHRKNVYLAEIKKEFVLNISVMDMIYFTGNINKHHPLRLQGVINRLLKENKNLTEKNILLSFDSLSEWIKKDFLGQNFPIIVDFLVKIHNLIYSSLDIEFQKVFHREDDFKYHYEKPNYILTDQEFYWFYELMNIVRGYRGYTPIGFKLDDNIKKLLQDF